MAKMLRKVFQKRSGQVASMLDTSGIEADGIVDNLADYSIRKPIGNPLGHEIYTSNSLAGPILASEESRTTAATKMTGSKDSNAIKPQSGNLRALLVDDNEINLRLLTACVKKLQHSHLEATNGLEALETYKSNNGQFDVVFMGS
jgi:PleD family two-component response regulator